LKNLVTVDFSFLLLATNCTREAVLDAKFSHFRLTRQTQSNSTPLAVGVGIFIPTETCVGGLRNAEAPLDGLDQLLVMGLQALFLHPENALFKGGPFGWIPAKNQRPQVRHDLGLFFCGPLLHLLRNTRGHCGIRNRHVGRKGRRGIGSRNRHVGRKGRRLDAGHMDPTVHELFNFFRQMNRWHPGRLAKNFL